MSGLTTAYPLDPRYKSIDSQFVVSMAAGSQASHRDKRYGSVHHALQLLREAEGWALARHTLSALFLRGVTDSRDQNDEWFSFST